MPAPRDIELELKLEAAPDALDRLAASPLLHGIEVTRKEQVSTYFDAPGAPLRAAGLSLRVRQSGARYVQTVKAESAATAGLFARPEWERAIARDTPAIDEAAGPLTTLLPAATLGAIAPAFVISVTRRAAIIAHDGASIELVLDVGEIRAGDRTAPIAEAELELKAGPAEALFSLARAMSAIAPLRLGVLAKSERGYQLALGRGRRAIKAEDVVLPADLTTAEAFQRIAGGCLRQFRLNEALLQRDDATEALHQARVALRRLRSALSIFRPILTDARFDHFRTELRWLASVLGEARDLDVLIARVGKSGDPALRTARDAAYANVHAALDTDRTRALMIDLSEWIAIGGWRTDPANPERIERPAAAFAADVLSKYRRRLRRRGHGLARLSDEQRHEVRILAKTMRYAAGFFASLFTAKKSRRRASRFLSALADLQAQLGDLNDLSHGPIVLDRIGLSHLAIVPPPGRRKALIAAAAEAQDAFADAKRFWR